MRSDRLDDTIVVRPGGGENSGPEGRLAAGGPMDHPAGRVGPALHPDVAAAAAAGA